MTAFWYNDSRQNHANTHGYAEGMNPAGLKNKACRKTTGGRNSLKEIASPG